MVSLFAAAASLALAGAESKFVCRDGDALFEENGETQCEAFFTSPSGFNFTEALSTCTDNGYGLLSVASSERISRWSASIFPLWLNTICDESTGRWQWENKQELAYDGFEENNTVTTCSEDARVAVLANGKWIVEDTRTRYTNVVCNERAEEKTADEQADNGLSEGWIVAIVLVVIIGVIALIFALRWVCAYRKKKHQKKIDEIESRLAREREAAVNAETEEHTDPFEIEPRHVSVDESKQLGAGTFGRVYEGTLLVQHLPPGHETRFARTTSRVAVKKLHATTTRADEEAFASEIFHMKMLGQHERIVGLLACVTNSTPKLIIMELMSNSLLNHLRAHKQSAVSDSVETISRLQQLQFATHIAAAVEYVGNHGLVHADISARNVLLDGQLNAKLGDFGLCQRIEAGKRWRTQERKGKLPTKWMAPESLQCCEFSPASDIWSFGVVLYEIVSYGKEPYIGWSLQELPTRLASGERMERPSDCCTDEWWALVTSCWQDEPSDRPSCSAILQNLAAQIDSLTPDGGYVDAEADSDEEREASIVEEEQARDVTA